jgi:hypothetical protein
MDTILLKDLHRFCEVHIRVGQNIVRWYLHLLSGFIHFIHCVKKATRSDDGYVVDLVNSLCKLNVVAPDSRLCVDSINVPPSFRRSTNLLLSMPVR